MCGRELLPACLGAAAQSVLLHCTRRTCTQASLNYCNTKKLKKCNKLLSTVLNLICFKTTTQLYVLHVNNALK